MAYTTNMLFWLSAADVQYKYVLYLASLLRRRVGIPTEKLAKADERLSKSG